MSDKEQVTAGVVADAPNWQCPVCGKWVDPENPSEWMRRENSWAHFHWSVGEIIMCEWHPRFPAESFDPDVATTGMMALWGLAKLSTEALEGTTALDEELLAKLGGMMKWRDIPVPLLQEVALRILSGRIRMAGRAKPDPLLKRIAEEALVWGDLMQGPVAGEKEDQG